ncbi:MAG: hypothetical protein Kow0099_37480 [Candidatus Abyssubacteria bacterium]
MINEAFVYKHFEWQTCCKMRRLQVGREKGARIKSDYWGPGVMTGGALRGGEKSCGQLG